MKRAILRVATLLDEPLPKGDPPRAREPAEELGNH
jgi:hypothetical protein